MVPLPLASLAFFFLFFARSQEKAGAEEPLVLGHGYRCRRVLPVVVVVVVLLLLLRRLLQLSSFLARLLRLGQWVW